MSGGEEMEKADRTRSGMPPSGEQEIDPPEHHASPATKVLYIEDNPANFLLISRLILQRRGIKIDGAATGEQGLHIAQTEQPDVIMLDLHLPDISGHAILQNLRGDARTTSIPVIIISADAMPHQVAEVMRAGAFAYLTKPLDFKRLLAALDLAVAPSER